jgi:hypothetical protein
MKRKPTPAQQLYHTERDRMRRRREGEVSKVMEEARKAFEAELEANRAKGRGGRPRKARDKTST